MPNDPEVIELYVELGHAGDQSLDLRMSPQISDEVLALLDENGIAHGTILEHSAGAELWVEAVQVLGAAGGLASLAAVINAFMRRHDGKKVVIERGDESIEIAGHSERVVERILKRRAEEQAARDAEWERIKRLGAPGDKP